MKTEIYIVNRVRSSSDQYEGTAVGAFHNRPDAERAAEALTREACRKAKCRKWDDDPDKCYETHYTFGTDRCTVYASLQEARMKPGPVCPRCNGDGEEPGASYDHTQGAPLCGTCQGDGYVWRVTR